MPWTPTIYDALRAYWKFDDSAAPGRDSSGYDHAGTLSNAALDNAGLFGSGLRTSSAVGKMTAGDTLALRQFATTRVSISVWINLDKALDTMWGTPVFLDKTGGTTRGYFLGVLPGGGKTISFRVHNSAGTPYTVGYVENATSGWVHVVGVYEGANVRIYRNGVSQGTAASDGTLRHSDADVVDNIGLGFEGVIDELSVWGRMLSSSDVTALYAAGAGLQLLQPDMDSTVFRADVERSYVDPGYVAVEAENPPTVDYENPVEPDAVPMPDPSVGYGTQVMLSGAATSPYVVRDSPKRLYMDPNPNIVSLVADSGNHIVAVGNGGPTDAEDVMTWWEIELLPGQVFVVAERHAHNDYEVNHDQTDEWDVPLGQDWRGLSARFFIQAVADASQIWASDPMTLVGDGFDNAPIDVPTFTNPNPLALSVAVDDAYNVTVAGKVGPTTSANLQTWWEVDLSGTGEFRCIADIRFPVSGATQVDINDVFFIPVGVNLNGKSIRLGARAEFDTKQVWYSAPLTMVGIGFDHSGLAVAPLPPGPSLGPVQQDTRGKMGPGVYRVPVRDNSRR